MKPAAKSMEKKIYDTNFNNPLFTIINNVTANPEVDPNNIKRLLIEQIFSTVRWRESIIKMHENGKKFY